jgi:two-component system OmpR family sensor kinase
VSRLLPSSLTGRLVATSVALVALAGLLLALATTAVLRSYLTNKLDEEVGEAAGRSVRALQGGPAFPAPERPRDDDGDGKEPPDIEAALGQSSGTVTAYFTATGSGGELVTDTREVLAADALAVLADVPAGAAPRTVELPDLGSYRVVGNQVGAVRVVTGLPTGDVDDTVIGLLVWELGLTLAAVVVVGGIALVLVRRQLRPLREVASTAHDVAAIPLTTGEVGVTARVPDELVDERTEVGQVGAALNTLLGHVEHALDERHRSEQQVRQFVADASHELRTPLATISGYAELSRRAGDAEQLRQAMGKVQVEAGRMSSLVEDLLLLARLDAGRPLERKQVDLTKLVLESAGDARVIAPDHRWVLELGDEPVLVTGDEQRLHQVLANLLANARRHTPAGTTVTVGVRGSDDGRSAVLTVSDDGPGIGPELLGEIFDRFTRGDSARTRASGGAGLGLSLARAIVEAHGGRIGATSEPGATRFTVTLPR